MGLEKCGRCTAPIYVRAAAVWNEDGTITGRFAGRTRVVQLYADEINHILDGISQRIGLDITPIVVEGERKAGIRFTGSILSRWRGLVGAIVRCRLFSRFVFSFVARGARNAGLGNCRLAGYRHLRELIVEFEDPFCIPILAGDILGAFEAMCGKSAKVSWEGDKHRARITVRADGGEYRSGADRLEPRLPVTVPGKVCFERCPRCRIPLEVTRRYSFDLKRGIATEVESGRRIVTVMIDSLNAVFKELACELGEDLEQMIVDLEAEYSCLNLPKPEGLQGLDAVRLLLGDLTIKGMGNPVSVTWDDQGSLTVNIDNPFNEEMLAGRVLGCYRLICGEESGITWTPDVGGRLTVKVGGVGRKGRDSRH